MERSDSGPPGWVRHRVLAKAGRVARGPEGDRREGTPGTWTLTLRPRFANPNGPLAADVLAGSPSAAFLATLSSPSSPRQRAAAASPSRVAAALVLR